MSGGAAARRDALPLGLMAASGFAALGYQIVWTQQAALWLGHELAAVLAVVAAFFGGLGVGALALGPRIDRSRHPARWYAACEGVVGLWAVALAFLVAPAGRWLLEVTGEQPSAAWQWTVAFAGMFLLLLPSTAAMGATLPAMERAVARLRRRGSSIGSLYAANTFGAVAGVLAAAFWLVPELGLARTAAACAVLSFVCAGLAWKAFPMHPGAPATASASATAALPLLAATGLLGIGYEVLVVRVLSQVAENTVYTFAMLLAVYLIGTATGAAAYQRWLAGRTGASAVGDTLLRLLAVACLAGTSSLLGAAAFKHEVLRVLGPGMSSALAAEAALATAAFLLPTIAMGAVFSHLSTTARAAGIGFGRALGVNTLGAAGAPLLFGALLAPAVGAKAALLVVAAAYLGLSFFSRSPRGWTTPTAWIATAAAAGLAIWAPPLAFVDVPDGGRIVSYREGPAAAVSVVADAGGALRLRIDNREDEGSSATLFADARQALVPILLHPAPRHALFLGLGTGITAASATRDPLLRVDAVELLPEVIEASAHFRTAIPDDDGARLRVIPADARRFVRVTHQRYDLIVSDNFHPARSGSGTLYTMEHFQAVQARLAPGGVFCQWLPLHQLDLATLRSIARTFLAVFPSGWAVLATNSLETPVVGLVARADGGRFDVAGLRRRLASLAAPASLAELGLHDDLALFGSFIAGPAALARFAGDAPLNTDDRPVVAYSAPRATYAPDSRPRDRLINLLRAVELRPDELVAQASDAGWNARLASYWAARNRFVEAGRDVRPTRDVGRMLSQVREPLLAVLATSPDFRPAYDPLLRMALALASVDAPAARALLVELRDLQPSRREAPEALKALSNGMLDPDRENGGGG